MFLKRGKKRQKYTVSGVITNSSPPPPKFRDFLRQGPKRQGSTLWFGNKNETPLANKRYIVSFMYSEYLDSSSTLNESPMKFSKDKKKFHITGIRKYYEKR